MHWDDFRVFLAIADEGTLSAAARRLRVDQSTVSRRLAALESAAETRLFERTADGYVPTPVGEAVRGRLEQMEKTAVEVERVLLGHDQRIEGRVRLATSDSFAAWFVVRQLASLRARHPGLVVDLVTGNLPVDLTKRAADVSIRLVKPAEPHLVSRKLGTVAWALYASRDYIAAHGSPGPDLEGHAVIGYDEELANTAGARWLREHAGAGEIVLTTNSLLSQAAAVVAGLGVSTLPCVCGDRESSLRRLPPGVVGHHDIWLVVHPDVKTSARVRAVMDHLVECVGRERGLLDGTRRNASDNEAGSRRAGGGTERSGRSDHPGAHRPPTRRARQR